MSKKRVRLSLNEKLTGSQGTYTVRGNLSLRTWDREDNRYYDWEEWELISFNKGNVWLECDHYNREVSLYEPIGMPEELPNPETLTVGERIRITLPDGSSVRAKVEEAAVGEITASEGTTRYDAHAGDKIAYAVLRYHDDDGVMGQLNIETYNGAELACYTKTILSEESQILLFGKRLLPRSGKYPGMLGVVAMILAVIAVVVIVSFIASKATEDETEGTYDNPETGTENTYDPDGGYYPYHRPVYRPRYNNGGGYRPVYRPRYGNDGGGYRPRSVYGGGGGGIGK